MPVKKRTNSRRTVKPAVNKRKRSGSVAKRKPAKKTQSKTRMPKSKAMGFGRFLHQKFNEE